MQRICNALASAGYSVTLVGRTIKNNPPLTNCNFHQKRIDLFAKKGPLFYIEYNIRLFFYLLFQPADLICAIDLDTILPCYFASRLKGTKRVYDAHEYFTEQKEIVSRPSIYKIWMAIEKFSVPKFKDGYTVNNWIAAAFEKRYGVQYQTIRNLPVKYPLESAPKTDKFILYQGAVNEGRCFETLIPAMKNVDCKLVIYGNGNFLTQSLSIIKSNLLTNKVSIEPAIPPAELRKITPTAYIGLTLFDQAGLNQYYSLANRFFDYIMAGIPQLCVDYPEYRAINDVYEVAYLIPNTESETIAAALNKLLDDNVLYKRLQLNCLKARETLHWNHEQLDLFDFYKNLFI
ncbi:MAG: glycosyltransferase [Sediminibacterium sp.]|nr:MAG: glycosyltransferase [Sediminibacterium sp.]